MTSTHTSAFDSTDPGTVIARDALEPIGRTLLTLLAIDPGLVRDVERDRLRATVKLILANPGNDLIGMAFYDLRKMWKRGFPVGAFEDDTLPMVDIASARFFVNDLRGRLNTRLRDEGRERAHVERILVLLGYDAGRVPETRL